MRPETPAHRAPENPDHIFPSTPYPAAMGANWIASQPVTPETPQPSPYYPYVYAWPGPAYIQPSFKIPTSSERAPESDGERTNKELEKDTMDKRAWRTGQEKLEEVFALFNSYSWTLGDLLWYIFAMQDKNGRKFKPSSRHYQIVSRLLSFLRQLVERKECGCRQ